MERYVTRRERQELRAKKRKRIIIVTAIIAVLCLAGVVIVPLVIRHVGVTLYKTDQDGSESIVCSDPGSIPDYSGKDYIVLNGDKPEFNAWDLENVTGEHYSELDGLGRCGAAYAMLDRTMMAEETMFFTG
ncbi:MAG: hypothetical protein K6G30_04785 [Acetatifactor sp.]|nr:hypothetical protein [Acetatifactor sp.]